ncbi:hypothetical protein KKB99_07470 [bacterium]|nr:hypothetical protein [bacterium]MBU1025831.1 hypothetical protein [bacterium]
MKVYMSPFGYISNKILLPILFTIVATIFLFYDVILKLVIIGIIGFIGWMIGSILDDRQAFNRIKYHLQSIFSRRGRY